MQCQIRSSLGHHMTLSKTLSPYQKHCHIELVARIIQQNNLTVWLIIRQKQSWPSVLLLHVYLINHNWIQCWFVRLFQTKFTTCWSNIVCPDVSAEHYYTIKYMETTTILSTGHTIQGFIQKLYLGGGTEDCVKANYCWGEGRLRYFSHEHFKNLGCLRLLLVASGGFWGL